jgi:hypothetical protein
MASVADHIQSLNQISSSDQFTLYVKLLSGDILEIDIEPNESADTFHAKIFQKANPDTKDAIWKIDLFREDGEQVNLGSRRIRSIFKSGDMLYVMISEPTLQIIRTEETLYDGRIGVQFTRYLLAILNYHSTQFWYNPTQNIFAEHWIEMCNDFRTGNNERTLLSMSHSNGYVCQDPTELFHKILPSKYHQLCDNQFANAWSKIKKD